MTPIHLERYDVFEGYDVFGNLGAWAKADDGQKRHWNLRQWEKKFVACTLSWRFGDSQLGGVQRIAPSPEQAVWMALEEFRKWEKSQ